MAEILMFTTPLPPGYKIVKNLGVISGLTARTRGMGGKFVAGLQSTFGGEVSAFSSEIEKARAEALDRLRKKAEKLGANALVGVDIETSEVSYYSAVLVSVTATALVVEKGK